MDLHNMMFKGENINVQTAEEFQSEMQIER